MAQRLVRAKRKIRQAGISLRPPGAADRAERLDTVLRVVYLVFTQGHRATAGQDLIRGELCDQAVGLARVLAALMPGEPEVAGLLALLLLTDARRGARIGDGGDLVLLADQDRTRWDRAKIAEGDRLLEAGAAGPPSGALPAARRDRRLPFVRRDGRGDRLAADRRPVRAAHPLRADARGRGEPGCRGGDGRGTRGGARGARRRGRTSPAGALAAVAHRPGRTPAPPRPRDRGGAGLPGRAAAGPPGRGSTRSSRAASGTWPPAADGAEQGSRVQFSRLRARCPWRPSLCGRFLLWEQQKSPTFGGGPRGWWGCRGSGAALWRGRASRQAIPGRPACQEGNVRPGCQY